MTTAGTTTFDRATAVERIGDGRYRALLDHGFWVVRGPNGGYLAAILLRALSDHLGEPERQPRSLTVHYLRAPAEGEARIETRVERRGRSLATLSARLSQGGATCALALAAFSPPWEAAGEFDHARAPAVPPPDDLAPLQATVPIPIREQFELRPLWGAAPFSGADEATVGGWIRTTDHRPLDRLLVAALTDAWYPAAFPVLERPAAMPTVDLTIHFRAQPQPHPDGWALARFRSRLARDGFVDEDGELWTPDGTLVAQSRQLALMF